MNQYLVTLTNSILTDKNSVVCKKGICILAVYQNPFIPPDILSNILVLNFIFFTTITKQVIQLILITLVGTDVCVRMVFVWEETGVPGGNPPV